MLIIIDNVEIKSVKNFIKYITENEINDYENIKILDQNIYDNLVIKFIKKDKDSLIKFIKLFRVAKRNNVSNYIFYKYYEKIKEHDQSIDRYVKYIEYKKINPFDCKSDKYYQLLYNDKWKEYKDNELNNRKSVYDPNYISQKMNILYDEAVSYINKYKKNKATSLKGFIERWGEEEGKVKFKKFQETSRHGKEIYIDRYGENLGLEKWAEFCKIKRRSLPSTIEYWEHLGYTNINFIKEKISEFQRKNTGIHMEYLIIKYGEDGAIEKWNELNKRKSVSLKTLINKYGYDIGYEKWLARIEKMIKRNTELGIYLPRNKRNEFKKYKFDIINITKRNLKLYGEEKFGIGWESLIGNVDLHEDYHIDHNYSIKEGFVNNIDPEIIGHIENLQMLTKLENCTKKAQCHISIKK
jgi:hypothetical protein